MSLRYEKGTGTEAGQAVTDSLRVMGVLGIYTVQYNIVQVLYKSVATKRPYPSSFLITCRLPCIRSVHDH